MEPGLPWGLRPEDAEGLLDAIEKGWGKGVAFEALVASQSDNPAMRSWWARYQRLAASPGAAVTLLRRAFDTDARAVLPSIRVPTLVLHRIGDPFTGVEHGRYLAHHIAGTRYVELAGVDHLFFAEDTDRLLAEIQEFLTGERETVEAERVLATVLFADIVNSTEHAARWATGVAWPPQHVLRRRSRGAVALSRPGDRHRWRQLVRDVRRPRQGDPLRAARSPTPSGLGIEVRVGLHTGECEVIGAKVGGLAVHIGARFGAAGPSEVLVSRRSRISSPVRG